MKQLFLSAALLLSSLPSLAATIVVGKPLPAVTITERGELILKGDDIEYKPWHSSSLKGRVHVFQYMAARMSTRAVNEPFTDAIHAAHFPHNKLSSFGFSGNIFKRKTVVAGFSKKSCFLR